MNTPEHAVWTTRVGHATRFCCICGFEGNLQFTPVNAWAEAADHERRNRD